MNKEHRIRKTLLPALSAVMLISSLLFGASAWFITANNAGIREVRSDVLEIPGFSLGIKQDDGSIKWSDSLSLTIGSTLTPVCGDGISFFSPRFGMSQKYADGEVIGYRLDVIGYDSVTNKKTTDLEIGADLKSKIYIADFIAKAEKNSDIYIEGETGILPADDSKESVYIPGVSTGYIAGSARMAIFKKTNSGYELCCIVIPNPNYEINEDLNSFSENGLPEKLYKFIKNTNGDSTDINYNDNGYAICSGIPYIWDTSAYKEPIAAVRENVSEGFRIAVWLDGNDRECVNLLSDSLEGGKITLKLSMKAVSEE